RCRPGLSISSDQAVRRTVMANRGLPVALEFRNDALCQRFAKFHSPLVERIDLPNGALREDGMFVESDELADSLRREPGGQDRVRWTIALEDPLTDERIRGGLAFDLVRE